MIYVDSLFEVDPSKVKNRQAGLVRRMLARCVESPLDSGFAFAKPSDLDVVDHLALWAGKRAVQTDLSPTGGIVKVVPATNRESPGLRIGLAVLRFELLDGCLTDHDARHVPQGWNDLLRSFR